MARPGLVLIADDDPDLRDVLRYALRREGFATIEAADGLEALAAVETHTPDLLVLDVMMPGLDGIEVCRRIRAGGDLPIIFLTSRDGELDRVLGLELGGDDYVTKPFSPRELAARVRAVLRRRGGVQSTEVPSEEELRHGPLRLDAQTFRASWDGEELCLTAMEFRLLAALLGYPGKVYTRDELMGAAYPGGEHVSERTIDSHVRRIRAKLAEAGGDPIETVRGVGYRLGSS